MRTLGLPRPALPAAPAPWPPLPAQQGPCPSAAAASQPQCDPPGPAGERPHFLSDPIDDLAMNTGRRLVHQLLRDEAFDART